MPRAKRAPVPRLGAAVDTYLQIRRGDDTAAGSLKQITFHLDLLVEHFRRDAWLSEITPLVMQQLFSDPEGVIRKRKDGKGEREAQSINNIRSSWHCFFSFARDEAWLTGNPFRSVKKRKVIERDRLWLSRSEATSLLDLPTYPTHRLLMQLQTITARRICEATVVKVENLELGEGYYWSWVLKLRKWRKKEITPDLDKSIRAWLVQYEAMLGRQLRGSDFLIPSVQVLGWKRDDNGKIPYAIKLDKNGDPCRIAKGGDIVKRYLKELGYDMDSQASHVLRRTGGRLLYDRVKAEGGSHALEAAADLLDHKDLRQTWHYLNCGAGAEAVREAMQGVNWLVHDETNVSQLRAVENG